MDEHGEISGTSVRVAATRADAELAGKLLDDFLIEFETPSPGAAKFGERLANAIAADDGLLVLLAHADGAPVGLAVLAVRPTCFVDGRAIMLEELYVVPERRGQRIGSALIRFSITEARSRGVEFFEVGVDEGDVDARRFYERHGFTNMAVPGSDERMLYFELELDPG